MNRARKVLIVAILAVIIAMSVLAFAILSNRLLLQGNVYGVCSGMTYNLDYDPNACGTIRAGDMFCQYTTTSNGVVIIMLSETPENQTCS